MKTHLVFGTLPSNNLKIACCYQYPFSYTHAVFHVYSLEGCKTITPALVGME